MADRPYNVLFLCTGNSARSILAEALINQWGRGKFEGFSAGSHPKGAVHPIALELLKRMKLRTEGLRSKSWDEFAAPHGPPLGFVFTVCDNAAGEVCPYWPGQPMTAHWGLPDPAAVDGSETDKWVAFRHTFKALENRIKIFTSLPLAPHEPGATLGRRRDRLAAPGGDGCGFGGHGRAPVWREFGDRAAGEYGGDSGCVGHTDCAVGAGERGALQPGSFVGAGAPRVALPERRRRLCPHSGSGLLRRAILAHAMFDLPWLQSSTHVR